MQAIRKYALCVETDPAELVASVTKLAGEGFVFLGGISMVREPANPSRGQPLGITRYAQAMVLVAQHGENPLLVNGR